MRVEYINPFVETSYRVLKEVLGGAEVKRGNPLPKIYSYACYGSCCAGWTCR